MGFYREQILPRVVDKALGNAEVRKWRERTVSGLAGEIVEIGFGSGLNIPVYTDEITSVHAIDPAVVGRKLAQKRLDASPVKVLFEGLDGEALPLDDGSVDGALCTFTLCTVPNPERAITEIHRVLRPGGRFHFLEHGLAPDPSVAKWQHRLDPIQRRLFDGCHLSRDSSALVAAGGFDVVEIEQQYAKGPKPFSYFTRAAAVRR